MKNRILQPHIFQFYILHEEEPVGDIYPYITGIKQGILSTILNQRAFQPHSIEEVEVDMPDFDCSLKISREFAGYLAHNKVLDRRGLN